MSTALTEGDWESHEATIRSLYLSENRKLQGPGGVMEEMLSRYGFSATKAQYERRFKKWGFQKNKKKDVWELVARKVTKRKRNNKDSEVAICGEVVPMKKLRKELSRYGYESAFPYEFQAPTPKTPEDLSLAVYTPQSHSLRYDWSPNLPWFRFEQSFAQILDTLSFNYSSTLEKRSDSLNDSLYLWLGMQSPASSGDTNIQQGEMALSCIIPELYEGQNLARARSILSPGRPGASLESLKTFLYAFSNNFINDLGNMKTTIAFARTFLNMWADRLPKSFDALGIEPTLVALLGKCFQVACNSSDLDVIELCLKIGTSPNLTVWSEGYEVFMKPIQIATFMEDMEMAQLLVRYGADVNKIGSPKQPSALSIAFLFQNTRLSRFLLSSGADPEQRFNPKTVNELGNLLCEYIYPWIRDLSPLSILVSGDWESLVKSESPFIGFFQEILEKTAVNYLSKSHEECLAHLIIFAVLLTPLKHFESVIQTLIRSGGNINTESISGILPISLAVQGLPGYCSTLLSFGAKTSVPRTSRYYNTRPAALHCAALHGNVEDIQALLKAGADVNHYVAFENRDFEINYQILILEENGSEEENIPLQQYHTPLQFALAVSSLDPENSYNLEEKSKAAFLLLSRGAKIYGGEIADAVELGDLELVRLLYQCGASINEKSFCGLTPLQTAIQFKHHHIVRFLLDSGAKLQGRELSDAIIAQTPDELLELLRSCQTTSSQKWVSSQGRVWLSKSFEGAFLSGEENVVAQILQLYPSYYEPSVLWAAIGGYRNSISKIKFEKLIYDFLKRTTDTMSSKFENTAIAIAAGFGYTNILDIFLRKFPAPQSQVFILPGLSIERLLNKEPSFLLPTWRDWGGWDDWESGTYTSTESDCSPLVAAISNGSEEILVRLLDHGFCPDTTSVLLAVKLGKRRLLAKLIDKGVDLNQRYPKFDTPLQMAVRLNRAKIVEHFLNLNVDVNSDPPPAVWGDSFAPRTALQLAVESKNMDLVHKLIDMGADVNAPAARHSGATALQLAAAKGYLGLAKLLIEHGADINADGAKISGRTALEIAAEHGRIDMIQFFFDCVPGALTDGDYTQKYIHAVRLAERNGHMGAAMILRNFRHWAPRDCELYDECGEFSDQDDEPEEMDDEPEETGDESEEADDESEEADDESEEADDESEEADDESEEADDESEEADDESEEADDGPEEADDEPEEEEDESEEELEKADNVGDVLRDAESEVETCEEVERGNSNIELDVSNGVNDIWWSLLNS